MKLIATVTLLLGLAVALSTGCGKKAKAGGNVDVAPLQKQFEAADPASKEVLTKAVAEIKAAQYPEALADLGRLNRNENLSSQQKQAVNTVMQQLATLLPTPNGPMAPMVPQRR